MTWSDWKQSAVVGENSHCGLLNPHLMENEERESCLKIAATLRGIPRKIHMLSESVI